MRSGGGMMSYNIAWHVEGSSARITVGSSLTIEELDAMGKELIRDYLDIQPSTIHVVADAREMIHFPIALLKIKQTTEPWLNHRNMGWLVFIGDDNMMVKFIV